MKLTIGHIVACGVFAALLSATASQGATVFYTSASAFAAAEPAASPVSFSSLGGGQPYIHANGLTLPGLTFSTVAPGMTSSALIVFRNSVGNNWFGDTLMLTPTSSAGAIGAEVFSQLAELGSSPVSAPITETVYSGSTQLGQETVTDASGFFGVSSTSPITEVTFFSDCESDCSSFVNSVSLAAASAVPEPATWLGLMGGLAAMGTALRAGRRRASVI